MEEYRLPNINSNTTIEGINITLRTVYNQTSTGTA